MEENVSLYLGKALAPSTLRSYGTGQRRYIAFCQDANFQLLPLSEHTLCIFVAHLASEGLTHQTIKSYLSALRHYHIMSGRGDPFIGSAFPLLQYVLRGIKRSPTHAPRQPCLPITPAILWLLKVVWSPLAVSGHSFRIGAATTAALRGVEDSVIKMLGRWESSAYQRYLRTPRKSLAALSARLIA